MSVGIVLTLVSVLKKPLVFDREDWYDTTMERFQVRPFYGFNSWEVIDTEQNDKRVILFTENGAGHGAAEKAAKTKANELNEAE
jgi:hypothetical protein